MELRQGGALNVSEMADGNDHGIVRIEILCIKLLARILYFGTAFVTILLLYFLKFVFHHFLAKFWIVEYLLQVSYEFLKFVVLVVKLVHLKACELAEAHVYNSSCLYLIEVETVHQTVNSLLWGL